MLGLFGAVLLLNRPLGSNGRALTFTIAYGEPARVVAERLQRLGIIRSHYLMRAIVRLNDSAPLFRHGSYSIDSGLSTLKVHDYLTTGKQELQRITIPEGWTLNRIAAYLEAQNIVEATSFLQAAGDSNLARQYGIDGASVEGFLFPDTYLFPENYPAERIIELMVDNFYTVLEDIYPKYQELPAERLYDIVTLASIVEREYVAPDEAATIASVFYNRLDANMRLESCATVVYVMTEHLGLDHPGRLFFHDLDRESDYNTYRHAGLPPGPISNPGRVALYAALYPDNSDYRYFVLKGEGAQQHHFSRDFNEHSQASIFYLKRP